jgi:hypothetical protein
MKCLFKEMSQWAIVIAALLLIQFSLQLAFEDDVLEEQHYCEMVSSGAWGAYKSNVNCDGE